jgi:ZIP family zinc transporter
VVIGIILGTLILVILDLFLYTSKRKQEYKFFYSMTLHNIFEGLSIGLLFSLAYFYNDVKYLLPALSLTIGISLQNLPETFALAAVLYKENKSKRLSFFYSVLSSIVEPIFALIGFYLMINISTIMPYLLSFSGGSMIYLTIEELLPSCIEENQKYKIGLYAFIIGFCLMIILESI